MPHFGIPRFANITILGPISFLQLTGQHTSTLSGDFKDITDRFVFITETSNVFSNLSFRYDAVKYRLSKIPDESNLLSFSKHCSTTIIVSRFACFSCGVFADAALIQKLRRCIGAVNSEDEFGANKRLYSYRSWFLVALLSLVPKPASGLWHDA